MFHSVVIGPGGRGAHLRLPPGGGACMAQACLPLPPCARPPATPSLAGSCRRFSPSSVSAPARLRLCRPCRPALIGPQVKQTLLAALEARGYTTLTPVQAAVTRPELEGADLLVSAQTGSGKTVGFGLAIAPALLGEAEVFGPAGAPLALVIAPTRELALQVKRELEWLYESAGAVLASCVGGMDYRNEKRALDRGAHIVVATPGRLCDHLRRGSIDLSAIRAVVLDEADEMLDLGFREDLEVILDAAPAGRQTLLFSATVPAAIAQLAKQYQRDAQRVATQSGGAQHSDIDYRAITVADHDEENAITNLLRFHEAPGAIIFANTRAAVARLVSRLSNRGFSVVSLSGELSQAERSHALQAMRDGRARVCVATDVAARGIDLPNLDLVVHAELPTSAETLLHRSGRTGRAGRKGLSALIVPPRAVRKAERLLREAKLNAAWEPAPSADAVLERDEARMLADPVWTDPVSESEERALAQILAAHPAEAVALAMLRLWRGQRSAPEELLPIAPRGPFAAAPGGAPAGSFGPSRWFAIPIGRTGNASPRWLMPKVCEAGGVTRREIGAIRIRDEVSYVEIAEAAVPDFLNVIGPGMEIAPGLALSPVDGLPEDPGGPRAPRPGYPRREADGAPRPAYKARAAEGGDSRPARAKYAPGKPGAAGKGKPYAKPKSGAPRPSFKGKPGRD